MRSVQPLDTVMHRCTLYFPVNAAVQHLDTAFYNYSLSVMYSIKVLISTIHQTIFNTITPTGPHMGCYK